MTDETTTPVLTDELALDEDQLQYLTDGEKTRLMRLRNLFATDGWGLVVKLMQVWAQDAHNRAADANNWDQNRLNVGLRAAYMQVSQLEQSTINEFIGIADERRAKALEANLADEEANQT